MYTWDTSGCSDECLWCIQLWCRHCSLLTASHKTLPIANALTTLSKRLAPLKPHKPSMIHDSCMQYIVACLWRNVANIRYPPTVSHDACSVYQWLRWGWWVVVADHALLKWRLEFEDHLPRHYRRWMFALEEGLAIHLCIGNLLNDE